MRRAEWKVSIAARGRVWWTRKLGGLSGSHDNVIRLCQHAPLAQAPNTHPTISPPAYQTTTVPTGPPANQAAAATAKEDEVAATAAATPSSSAAATETRELGGLSGSHDIVFASTHPSPKAPSTHSTVSPPARQTTSATAAAAAAAAAAASAAAATAVVISISTVGADRDVVDSLRADLAASSSFFFFLLRRIISWICDPRRAASLSRF